MDRIPRILLAAPSSGSGKTLITCGILQALVKRGKRAAAFKCGPDYIDPMFHSRVIGTNSRNLDPFFAEESMMKYLLWKNTQGRELAVLEGVMGYYDGLGGTSDQASTYEVAKKTKTPVILIMNTKGMGLSVIPWLKGLMEYRRDSQVKGVIFNRMSPIIYPKIKKKIEEELPLQVLGYVPEQREFAISSRHLGLVLPAEIAALQEMLVRFAWMLEQTVDINRLLAIAEEAPPLEVKAPRIPSLASSVRIGIAMDEAFSFYYQDSLELLKEMGAKMIPFSPLRDQKLHEMDGLLFGGGYPELYAEQLSENLEMRRKIKNEIQKGIPCVAECGGFLYLHEGLQVEKKGKVYPMAGIIPGMGYPLGRLGRFGYLTVEGKVPSILGSVGVKMPAHEFHYWESTDSGRDFHGEKPLSEKSWDCIHVKKNLVAGFPHLYFYGNIPAAFEFMKNCKRYQIQKNVSKR